MGMEAPALKEKARMIRSKRSTAERQTNSFESVVREWPTTEECFNHKRNYPLIS